MAERTEVGRIRMDSVNVSDLHKKLTWYMLTYGVDLDFGVDGPFMILTGSADASPRTSRPLTPANRAYVGMELIRDITKQVAW